ncbi:MAG TPA: ABC transporter ATP-binding protein [bacterium]|nr:ABC transporter ATP-binding protein [bacterium]
MRAKGARIVLAGLTKLYGDAAAVRDLNLDIAAGEFLTLLGPSGSGKTTTLMMIAGFVSPERGEIFIDETPVTWLPAQRRGIGMVFQNYALFPHMTVVENIAFPLQMRGVSRSEIRARTRDILELVQLPGYESRYPRHLSGGQQQRVALARALVFEPRVLLLDEPLSALDKKLRDQIRIELKHIHERLKITFIYVTHDQEEALIMSDRVAVMNGGRIAQLGAPRDLYDDPADAFVAQFIGETNLLRGVVDGISGGLLVVRHAGGATFRAAQGTTDARAGRSLLMSIRPEHLRLRPEVSDAGSVGGVADVSSAGLDGEFNAWRGRVEEALYVGDAVKYKIAANGEVLLVKQHGGDTARRPVPGDTVIVMWAPAHTKILVEPA